MLLIINTLRYLVLFASAFFISGVFAHQSWNIYDSIFHDGGSSWIDLSDIAGLMLNYIFLVPFTFVTFGEQHKYWLIVVSLIPILIFEFTSNFNFVTVDASLAIAGFIAAWLVRLAATHTLGKMSALKPLKKYF